MRSTESGQSGEGVIFWSLATEINRAYGKRIFSAFVILRHRING